jgi:predicted nucleic acid-binding protein
MSPIFLDADILLDVFAERRPFYRDAARILSLVEERQIEGCTSALIFAHLYYIIRKLRSRDIALTHLRKLHSLITVLPVDERSIDYALNSAMADFEDAIQFHTAKHHHIKYIITRNTKDYKPERKSNITISTADDYLMLWKSKSNTCKDMA